MFHVEHFVGVNWGVEFPDIPYDMIETADVREALRLVVEDVPLVLRSAIFPTMRCMRKAEEIIDGQRNSWYDFTNGKSDYLIGLNFSGWTRRFLTSKPCLTTCRVLGAGTYIPEDQEIDRFWGGNEVIQSNFLWETMQRIPVWPYVPEMLEWWMHVTCSAPVEGQPLHWYWGGGFGAALTVRPWQVWVAVRQWYIFMLRWHGLSTLGKTIDEIVKYQARGGRE